MTIHTTLFTSLFTISTVLGSSAMAEMISSSKMAIKPSRITNRVVLVESRESSLRVQVLSVFEERATDFSNTGKIILAISRLGGVATVEASFDMGASIGLDSARRVGPGIYQVTYLDANKGMEPQVRTIDARKAVSDIVNTKCGELDTCEILTSISVK